MKLTFVIENELDLVDEIPAVLKNISTLILALPHLQKATNMNDDVMINAGYFLCGAIDDIAEAVSQYGEEKLSKQREEAKNANTIQPGQTRKQREL